MDNVLNKRETDKICINIYKNIIDRKKQNNKLNTLK